MTTTTALKGSAKKFAQAAEAAGYHVVVTNSEDGWTTKVSAIPNHPGLEAAVAAEGGGFEMAHRVIVARFHADGGSFVSANRGEGYGSTVVTGKLQDAIAWTELPGRLFVYIASKNEAAALADARSAAEAEASAAYVASEAYAYGTFTRRQLDRLANVEITSVTPDNYGVDTFLRNARAMAVKMIVKAMAADILALEGRVRFVDSRSTEVKSVLDLGAAAQHVIMQAINSHDARTCAEVSMLAIAEINSTVN